jgi:hypothetical protein
MTRKSRREIERAVDDLETGAERPGDREVSVTAPFVTYDQDTDPTEAIPDGATVVDVVEF